MLIHPSPAVSQMRKANTISCVVVTIAVKIVMKMKESRDGLINVGTTRDGCPMY